MLSGHVQWVYCCSISPDCSMLCSAAGEKSVSPAGWELSCVMLNPALPSALRVPHHVRSPAVGQARATLAPQLFWFCVEELGPEPMCLKPQGGRCFSSVPTPGMLPASAPAHVPQALLWSMRSYTLIRRLEGHQSSVVSCDFSPDSALLVTASYDACVIMWDPYTGEQLRTLRYESWGASEGLEGGQSNAVGVCWG